MWVLREGVAKLYDVDVLFRMLAAMFGLLGLLPFAGTPTMNEGLMCLANVHLFHFVGIRLVSVDFEVGPLHQPDPRCC